MKSTLALLFASSTYAKECKALAMSGGGAKGSYEAGALWGLYYTDTDKSKYAYDVVTGVSAGGINTAAVSLFAPGDEENMLNFLTEQWQTLTEKQVFTNWKPAGIITGLLDYSGVFDTSPLMNLMDTIFKSFNYELKRKITVSCADVNTGNYVTFDETHPDYAKMIVSTASIPFAFPHQVWDNPDGSQIVCMDGGTVYNTNLVSAVNKCRETVDDDSEITIDIVICSSADIDTWEDEGNAINNFLRFRSIKEYHGHVADVYDFKMAYPKVNFRHYIQPSTPLPGGLAILNFNNETSTFPMQMAGRLDGENAIKQGDGYMFEKMEEYRQSPELKKQYPKIGDFIGTHIKSQSSRFKRERRRPGFTEDEEEEL